MVIALEQTIDALRLRAGQDWQEQIETLRRMREDTITRMRAIDPSRTDQSQAPGNQFTD